jgi:hypothetical protein
MLDDIERFLVGLKEHPFLIPEKIAAIRTAGDSVEADQHSVLIAITIPGSI